MQEIIVSGGRPLAGRVVLGGSKNAALPIIFATLVTRGRSFISRVPDITDVRVAIEIIEKFGASVKRCADTLIIDTADLHYERISDDLTSKIRASSYLIGASLARFGKFRLENFGGCNFCNRPIDMHLAAASALGAEICGDLITARSMKGTVISFEKPSVGATINAIIMATCAKGTTVLVGTAREPHVKNLISFLISAGAEIFDDGKKLIINKKPLSGGAAEIIPDMIEAGTFLLAAPLTGGKITVSEADKLELRSFLEVLSDSGVCVEVQDGSVTVLGEPRRKIEVKTAPHPGYPTDLQPQIAPLMAKFFGGSICESVWQNRFSYLRALEPFGIESITNFSCAKILPSKIVCAEAVCPDLRGGAAALLTALSAEGISKIKNADIIFRGYSELGCKLSRLGADVYILRDT